MSLKTEKEMIAELYERSYIGKLELEVELTIMNQNSLLIKSADESLSTKVEQKKRQLAAMIDSSERALKIIREMYDKAK